MFGTKIEPGARITEPGRYVLAEDVSRGGGTFISEACVRIESNYVLFDGGGHTLDGRGVSDTTGVAVTSSTGIENVVVRNVTVTDWDVGIRFRNVTGGVIHGVTVVGNGCGVSFENVRSVVLRDDRIAGNLLGLSLSPSSEGNTFSDDDVESNHGPDVFRRPGSTNGGTQPEPAREG